MRDIHPKYEAVKVTCSCGNTFETRSTLGSDTLSIEVCSQCHPFFTGKQKLIDTGGRVDRFMKKYGQKRPGNEQAESEPAKTEKAKAESEPAKNEKAKNEKAKNEKAKTESEPAKAGNEQAKTENE